jgi:hypothetical protein
MLAKALTSLAAVAGLVAVGIFLLAGTGAVRSAAFSGALLGAVCAFTAVLGAGYAQRRGLGAWGSLAVVVGGMMFRMVLVAVWAVVAFRFAGAAPVPFLAGFAAMYLPGQGIEIVLLRSKKAAGPDAPEPRG